MHSEDYVHRIGRTGRAHAVGDAISFVTNEDHGELRALERFIGRGIVRKKAEGFNYTAAAPAYNPADEERRHPRQQQQQRGQRPPRNQQRSHSSSSQPRPPQSARPQHGGGRPQHRDSGGPPPVSGNREGANLRTTTGRPQFSGGQRRRFGSR
jgi:ATP-dependent RNA helicase RhlE